MGKVIDKGLAPPDHPMFSDGPRMFSIRRSRPSTETSPKGTTGAKHTANASVTSDKPPETK